MEVVLEKSESMEGFNNDLEMIFLNTVPGLLRNRVQYNKIHGRK